MTNIGLIWYDKNLCGMLTITYMLVSTTIPLLTSLGSSIKSYSPERFVTQASQQHMDQSDTAKLIKGKQNIRESAL